MENVFDKYDFLEKENIYFYVKNINIEQLPLRINRSLHEMEISPYAILISVGKPLVLFFENNANKELIFKQCWNFSESPIIFIETENDFELYNAYEFIIDNGEFLLEKLDKENFNYISIINGDYFNQDIFKKTENKIDKKLLENIKNARLRLLAQGINKELANALLGRIIFIRYLIDRKVKLSHNGEKQLLNNDKFVSILNNKKETYELFRYLKSHDGFNGDWFPILENEENLINEIQLKVLSELVTGTEIKTGQRSLFDIYDFSIIPIEFISNVYESFIGEETQSQNGAFYTPTFLVDYILKYTIDDYFAKNPNSYSCKVIDPACGSGIFLVETLRKLINQFEKIKKRLIKPDEIISLVEENIYAIDKDKNAIMISIFSLYLTMLDYLKPKDIEKFKFPNLLKSDKNPNPNFFNADFFDYESEYNNSLKNVEFNFIIGNPPYKRGAGNSRILTKYLSHRKNSYDNIKIGNKEISQAFMLRSSDFSKNTKIAFILNSKNFYNLQSIDFRKYFLSNYSIDYILELSSVRNEVFPTAKTPVLVMFYRFGREENQLIKYISIKPSPLFSKLKMLFISKQDFKKVLQQKLLDNDYLWKTLIYGDYLDFELLKKLKSYNTIKDNVDETKQGITVGGTDINSADEYVGMPFVETKQFRTFFIEDNDKVWETKIVHRQKDRSLFKSPSLLISKGINRKLDLKMGILRKDAIFTDSITAVKCKNKDVLYNVMGILGSSIFKYMMIHTASSIGTEREQVHNPEKFNIPYIFSEKVINLVKEIEELSEKEFIFKDESKLKKLKQTLNENILKDFNLNEQEQALISYSENILIPWIMEKDFSRVFRKLYIKNNQDKDILINYLNTFIENFSEIFKNENKHLSVKIIYNKYAIGFYFTISKNPSNIEQIKWIEEQNISNFIKLSGNKLLENLFVQKDIKGFEKDVFYVIKPNEYKNWHKAVSYLDFNEFKKAILNAGKKQWKN